MKEEKQFGKVYDSKIVKKILTFLKPYKYSFILVLVFTIFISVLQTISIMISKTAIDDSIAVFYTKIKDYDKLSEDYRFKLNSIKKKYKVDSDLYVFTSQLGNSLEYDYIIEQKKLKNIEDGYYIGKSNKKARQVINKKPALFRLSEEQEIFIISQADLYKNFSLKERLELRNFNILTLTHLCLYLLFAIFLIMIFSISKSFFLTNSDLKVIQDIRVSLFDKTLRQSQSFLQENPVGRIVTRVTNDVQTISNFVGATIENLLSNIITIITVLATVFFLDVRLSIILLATTPVLIILTLLYRNYSRIVFREVRAMVSGLNSFLSESISGIEVLKHLVQEKKNMNDFNKKSDDLFVVERKQIYVYAVFRPLMDLVSTSSTAIIIYFSAEEMLKHNVSLGVLIVFLNLLNRFFSPIQAIAEVFTQLQQAMAGGERVFDLMDEERHIPDNGSIVINKHELKGDIEFKNVNFSYDKEQKVIKDMSFKIKAGESVALVGFTGSGKTTITNLVTRFWDIDSGQILLDGMNIKSIKLSSLRNCIQSLQQDVFLFNDTIKENILMGMTMKEEDFFKIIKLSQLEDLINSFPDKEKHMIEEGGKNLSAGQKQLISFARIMAQDPKVIIMDEATANIDTETESKIQIAMKDLVRNRTSIIVAHRLSTIQHSDKIFVLSEGKLIEEGSHSELINIEDGTYLNLCNLQYQSIGE